MTGDIQTTRDYSSEKLAVHYYADNSVERADGLMYDDDGRSRTSLSDGSYELLHFAYHSEPGSWLGRLPGMSVLRRHHIAHHDRQLMTRYNFNITYPICDYLFGTLYRGAD